MATGIAQAGKYLSFLLGGREYGLEILKVREINGMVGITRVPRAPEAVRGVMNLRGRAIPVVGLRALFHLPETADTERTCVVVAQVRRAEREVAIGVIVDEVSEVLNIGEGQIVPPREAGDGKAAGFASGTGRLVDRDVILLDIDRVMGDVDLEAVLRTTAPR